MPQSYILIQVVLLQLPEQDMATASRKSSDVEKKLPPEAPVDPTSASEARVNVRSVSAVQETTNASLKVSGASVQASSGLFRAFRIPLGMSPTSVDDMYYGCNHRMLIKVKRHYLPRSTGGGLHSTYTKHCALKAMKNKDPDDQLSWDNLRALCAYTAGAYSNLNQAVRTGKASYKISFHYHALHFLLTDAIQRLKLNQKGCYTTFRRSNLPFSGESGQVMRFGSFASSSLSKDLYQFGRRSCFEIRTCFGAYLKSYSEFDSDEDEVLIPPYEMFTIVSVDTSGGNDLLCDVVYKLETAGIYSSLNCEAVDLKVGAKNLSPIVL